MKSVSRVKRCVYKKVLSLIIIISGIILVTDIFPLKAIAQGNLLITPIRVVFEGQKKMHELNLANTGKDSAKFLVSFMEIKMNEDGTFEKITEPDSGQNFASNNLRFFPRTVMLAPGEAQLVKVQLTKTNQLTAGEYRSHIYFRGIPNEAPLGETMPVSDSTGISIKLVPVFGITIPVIIRVGESTTKVSLSNLSLDDSIPSRLHVTFNRTGNFSTYGDLIVNHVSVQGKITKVGNINGIAVYAPNAVRKFQMDLNIRPGINLHKGKLEVVYSTKTSGATTVPLAKAELLLQ